MDPEAILYAALAADIGVSVIVEDFERARAKLYAVRKRLADPALAGIQIRRGLGGRIWLIKASGTEAKGD